MLSSCKLLKRPLQQLATRQHWKSNFKIVNFEILFLKDKVHLAWNPVNTCAYMTLFLSSGDEDLNKVVKFIPAFLLNSSVL